MNNNITGTIVQLNEYPPDKFNVLIPVTTMQVMSNLQRIIVNKVQLDVADPDNSKDIYREKSSGKYAITKVGGMKLAAAANISIVETESGMTDGCKRCVDMARAVGKPKACGTCPARYDVAVTVTIRVPDFRRLPPHEGDEGNRLCSRKGEHDGGPIQAVPPTSDGDGRSRHSCGAPRSLGLAATYSLPELRKPFIIAHVVPNLDAPEIKEAVASNYLQSMGMLFEAREHREQPSRRPRWRQRSSRTMEPTAVTRPEVCRRSRTTPRTSTTRTPSSATTAESKSSRPEQRTDASGRPRTSKVQRAQVRTLPLHPLPEGGEGCERRPISMMEQHIAVCEALDAPELAAYVQANGATEFVIDHMKMPGHNVVSVTITPEAEGFSVLARAETNWNSRSPQKAEFTARKTSGGVEYQRENEMANAFLALNGYGAPETESA